MRSRLTMRCIFALLILAIGALILLLQQQAINKDKKALRTEKVYRDEQKHKLSILKRKIEHLETSDRRSNNEHTALHNTLDKLQSNLLHSQKQLTKNDLDYQNLIIHLETLKSHHNTIAANHKSFKIIMELNDEKITQIRLDESLMREDNVQECLWRSKSKASDADNNYSRAIECYENKNFEESRQLCFAAAAHGHAAAQNLLGLYYTHGIGTSGASDFLALKWYERSVQRGNYSACINLGLLYASGRAWLSVDKVKAKELFLRALQSENSEIKKEAQIQLDKL